MYNKEAAVIKNALAKLNRLLGLKNKYLEVYLTKGRFNVHSFSPPPNFPRPDLKKNQQNLGEIHLCPDYIKKEGGSLTQLLLHGLLHLLGYDHKKKSDRIRMEKKEKELWHKIS